MTTRLPLLIVLLALAGCAPSGGAGPAKQTFEALLADGYEVKAASGFQVLYLQKDANVYLCSLEYDQGKAPSLSGYSMGDCERLASPAAPR